MLSKKERDIANKVANLRDQLLVHEGKKAKSKISQFEVVFHIYSANKNELSNHLNKVADIEYAKNLFTGQGDVSRIETYREFVRLFHNYSLSIGSLIDITRRLMNKYYDENDILNAYQSKIDSIFVHNALAGFLKDLRNYFTHYQVPHIYQQLKLSVDKPNYSGFQLMRDKLLEDYNWKSNSKKFLKNQEERFDVLNLIISYDQVVDEFYKWLLETIQDYHSNDLKEMELLKNEIEDLRSRLSFTLL